MLDNTNINPNQKASGRSELLDAGEILKDILQLKRGEMVGDLGAGGGLFLLESARLVGDVGQVYAVDVVKNILSEIESKARLSGLNNIKTIWSNLEIVGATKINEASLDANILVNVLYQSKKHYEILAEAARLLKSGGRLLIVDWAKNELSFGPPPEMIIEPQKIIEICKQLDLNLVKEFKAGRYHFGLLLTKK